MTAICSSTSSTSTNTSNSIRKSKSSSSSSSSSFLLKVIQKVQLFILLQIVANASTATSTSTSTKTTINAMEEYEISNNDLNFHYKLLLSKKDDTKTTFYFNPPTKPNNDQLEYLSKYGNTKAITKKKVQIVKCRVVHESETELQKASWLGFGVQDADKYDSSSYSSSTNSNSNKMLGSNALIGLINDYDDSDYTGTKKGNVRTYVLNNIYEGKNGVQEILDPYASISSVFITRGFMTNTSTGPRITQEIESDGSTTTTFDFYMIVNEKHKSIDGVGSTSTSAVEKGMNLFLFAIGPSTRPHSSISSSLGKHVNAGSFVIDFDKIGTIKERSYEYNMSSSESTSIQVKNQCKSIDFPQYTYVITLPGRIKFYWMLDPNNDLLKVQLSHLGNAWIALGVPKDDKGQMIGADAIIALPAFDDDDTIEDEAPIQYHLSSNMQNGVKQMASSDQTLIESSLHQDDEETILRFTKRLEESGQNSISKTGMVTLIYAIGEGNRFSRHEFANSFNLDLNSCPDVGGGVIGDGVVGGNPTFKLSWIIHGVFGTLAFAVVIPFSISSAFLRQVLPTSWIYVHVYGNIVAFVLTMITFILSVVAMTKSGGEHFSESHHKIGLSLVILSYVQMNSGLFRPNKVGEGNLFDKKKRQLWKWFHRSLGLTILILGLFQVGDGLVMFAEDYDSFNLAPAYLTWIIIAACLVVGSKLFLFVFGKEERVFVGSGDDTEMEVQHLDQNQNMHPETEMT